MPNISTLTVKASNENNGSAVTCTLTVGPGGSICSSEKVELFVYGMDI